MASSHHATGGARKTRANTPRTPVGIESVRRHNARVCAEIAALRHESHRDQAARMMAVMSSLLNYREAEARKYGYGTTEGAE
jgi:hypothetical protein